jgi:hypothetical protein
MVCVRKKDMSLRLCIEYRVLNQKSVQTRRPISSIQDSLDSLKGNIWFSTLDQDKAYHQGYMKPECRPYTAFITSWVLYEWLWIPFGLSGAPGAFQQFMEEILAEFRDELCIPYLDDVLVFSGTFEEHLDGVRKILRMLMEAGIKLKPRKCSFFCKEVRFLTQLASKEGCRIDPEDMKAVIKLKDRNPTTVKEVRQMLGLLGYYRKYIPNFSKRASCLYALLKNSEADKLRKRKKQQPAKVNRFVWTDSHRICWTELIDLLVSAPIIAFPDFERPFILHTDASQLGLGAILYQRQNSGQLAVVAYASRTFTLAEQRYHLHSGKLSLLLSSGRFVSALGIPTTVVHLLTCTLITIP